MTRTAIIFSIFFMTFIVTSAQKSYRTSLTGINQIELLSNSNVTVEKGTADELILKYSEEENGNNNYKKEVDIRAKGLDPIYPGGVDNTGLGFKIEQKGGVLNLVDLKPLVQSKSMTLVIPNGISLHLDTKQSGTAYINEISSEIVINTIRGDIKMRNVTGPIVAHSSTGKVEIIFDKVSQAAPISVSATEGTIDVTLPADTRADVQLQSTGGTVYSNFDIEEMREGKDDQMIVNPTHGINGKINNGGVSISIRASTGNIYFRKK